GPLRSVSACRDPARNRGAAVLSVVSQRIHAEQGPALDAPEDIMPACYFIVRAIVADPAQRAAFDKWYADEHLPDAPTRFGAQKAWRFWSETDPTAHQATYQFADRAALDRGTRPENMTRLVADFDKAWPHIKRSREIMTLAQEWGG